MFPHNRYGALPGFLAFWTIIFAFMIFVWLPHAHASERHFNHYHWHHHHSHRYRRHTRWRHHERYAYDTHTFAHRSRHLHNEGTFHPVEQIVRTGSDVLRTAARYLGAGNVTGHRGPWCGFFLQKILRETGHYYNGSGRAIDARLLGPRTFPHPGAIAVSWRHTAFVAAVGRGRILLLGGNQGHRVSFMWHSMRGFFFVEPS